MHNKRICYWGTLIIYLSQFQAIWRNIQAHGLVLAYRNDIYAQNLFRFIMTLGFLPLAEVRRGLNSIHNNNETIQLIIAYPQLAQFLDYFERQWMAPTGAFPPYTWNVHERPMEHRTNNAIESFHSRWNSIVGVAHSSLWVSVHV